MLKLTSYSRHGGRVAMGSWIFFIYFVEGVTTKKHSNDRLNSSVGKQLQANSKLRSIAARDSTGSLNGADRHSRRQAN